MSEPVTKQRPTVDLDAFERRLRDSVHPHEDDPLAELARLVGDRHDPYGDVFAREPLAQPAAYQPDNARGPDYGQRQEPGFARQGQQPVSPRLSGDFAAIEAGLRGTVSPHLDAPHPHAAAEQHYSDQAYYDQAEAYDQAQATGHAGYAPDQGYDEANWAPGERSVPAAKSRRPVIIMAATIAVGVIGIGAAFALKGHSSRPSEVKTIMAAAGPTKIQPPADTTQDTTSQDSALLGKSNQAAPTKLVSHEEQPVDLSQAVQQNNAADAASIPVPLPPGQQQDAMNANPGAAISDQGFNITPKRVKSISVRPDGTILPNDEPPAAAMPAQHPVKTVDRAAPVAKASTPKSTSRVATTPKATQTAEADAAVTPKPTRKVKAPAQQVASAETTTGDAQETAAKTETGSGGWAVQLAAPGSEAEAKAVSSKLGKKFADALSGHRLGFHKADSKGKPVYRVRVGSLTREDATSLCDKLKTEGGTCFVAKN